MNIAKTHTQRRCKFCRNNLFIGCGYYSLGHNKYNCEQCNNLMVWYLVVIFTDYTGEDLKMEYIKRFRQGSGVIAMNAIDYYMDNGKIIEHRWANGGSSKKTVTNVPKTIKGYEAI